MGSGSSVCCKNKVDAVSDPSCELKQRSDHRAIAIVGIGCKTPGADNIREFWKLLINGECHVAGIPEDRWDAGAYLDQNRQAAGKAYVQRGGFIKDPDGFDNGLYGINDFEASQMDPQQRFLLDCTMMALEDAGITRSQISGSNTGVFIGCMNNDYGSAYIGAASGLGNYTATGVGSSVQAGRLSYVFNLLGPSMVLDTACSSSMMAVHQGCQAILNGDCDMAICGGVNSMTLPDMYIQLCKARMLSATGLSQAFSDKADGYARGEGCGIIILKPLKNALSDGDKIWATLCTGTNQDGRTVSPMTAPSGEQQKKLLHHVYGKFGVDVSNVEYIEAHGTGTSAGDPVEVNALGNFFKESRQQRDRFIGSLKTNIGHTESAAGALGIIKVVLMMKHDIIVPSLHCDSVNPKIDLDDLMFVIPKEIVPWLSSDKIAGCNSFGFGGSNCHAVLMSHETAEVRAVEPRPTYCVVCFSATCKDSLVGSLKDFQQEEQIMQLDVHDVSYTSTIRRDHYSYRAAFVTDSMPDLLLNVGNRLETGKFSVPSPKPLNVVFVFCGMGTAWQGMCAELLVENPVFRNTMMEVDKHLSAYVKWSLVDRLQQREDPTQDPVFGPLAIFACQAALSNVWQSFGITPACIVGQSIGEVAAAYAAGCLTLPAAVKIVFHRSKQLAKVTGGSMIVVMHASVNRVQEIISGMDAKASIALEYSPTACAVSADAKTMPTVKFQLLSKLASEYRMIQITELPVSVAYHSEHVDECVKNLKRDLKAVDAASPGIDYVSAVTGESLHDAPGAEYWMEHMRQPVLFSKAVKRAVLGKKPANSVLLEIGPKPVLPAHLNDLFPDQTFRSLPSVSKQSELKTLLQTVVDLYELGANVQWEEVPTQGTTITDIPRYVFSKKYNRELTEMEVILNSGCNFLRAGHLYTLPVRDDVTSFKLLISPLTVPTVYDHVLSRTIVIPGALYAEAALAVAKYNNLQNPVAVSVNFERAMSLKKDEVMGLDLKFEASQETAEFWRSPLVVQKDRRRLATINIKEDHEAAEQIVNLDLIRSRCKDEVQKKDLYASLRRSGFEYGEAFALLVNADKNSSECLVQLEVNEKVRKEMSWTTIHPCILDCMLQATLLLVPEDKGTMKDMLPKSMGRLSVHRSMEPEMLVYARRKETTPNRITYDQRLMSLDGRIIAELDDFVVQSLTPEMEDSSSTMLTCEWHKVIETSQLLHGNASSSKSHRLVYITNKSLENGTPPDKESSEVVLYDPNEMEENDTTFKAVKTALGDCTGIEAVVVIFSEDVQGKIDDVQTKLVNVICLIQTVLNALNENASMLPFVLCTTNAWPLLLKTTKDKLVNPAATALWGLLRTVVDENVYPSVVTMELQIPDLTWVPLNSLIRFTLSKSELAGYPEVLVTQEAAYVNQVIKLTQSMAMPSKRLGSPISLDKANGVTAVLAGDSTRVSGLIGITPVHSKDNNVDGVCKVKPESFVQANDRLVNMKVASDSLCPEKQAYGKTYLVMGLEIVGQKVDGSKCKVAVCHPTPIGAEVTVPDDITFAVAEICEYVAGDLSKLVLLWSLKKSVSAAKISVLASAQTKDLADLLLLMLKSSGNTPQAANVVLIEDLEHVTEIHETLISLVALDADLILSVSKPWKNAKQFIACSTLLSPEVVPTLMCRTQNVEVHLLETQLLYQLRQLREILPALKSWLADRKADKSQIARLLHSSPTNKRGTNDLRHLLEFKVHKVSDLNVQIEENELFRKDSTYVVVGGLTGLGWLCVEFLAHNNAGRIAIMSRRPSSHSRTYSMMTLSSKTNCQIRAFQADVSSEQSLRSVIQNISKEWPDHSIKGVFTGAAVLEDGLFLNMERSSFERVLSPKVRGTWNLHHLTKDMTLDYFVMHSSVASVLGNLGQANYAAGNAFLDGMAHYRRQLGLAAQTINWGPLDTGLLDKQDALKKKLDSMGFHLASQQEIKDNLRSLLLLNMTQSVPVRIDTELYAKRIHGTGLRPLVLRYRHLLPSTTSQSAGIYNSGDVDKIKFLEPGERLEAYNAYVTELTCRILSLDVAIVTSDVSLLDLGLDSVTGMMMINQIHRDTSYRVEAVHIFAQETSVMALAKTLDEYAQLECSTEEKEM